MNNEDVFSTSTSKFKAHNFTYFLTNRIKSSILLFLLCSPLFIGAEWISFLYFVVIIWFILTVPNEISQISQGLRLVWPFIVIIFIGFMQTYAYNYNDIMKDFWYFELPILTFMTGWVFAPSMKKNLRSRTVVLASLVNGVWFLLHLMTIESKISINDQYGYRLEAGVLDFIVVWGSLIALNKALNWRKLDKSWRKLTLIALIVNPLAIVLSFSRTEYASLVIAIFFVWLPSLVRKKRLYLIVTLVIIAICFLSITFIKMGSRDNGGFMARMAGSVREVGSDNFDNMSDVNTRWRAYEALMGLETFRQGNLIQLMIGRGLGAKVNLGIVMHLGDSNMQNIPILHNGYVYLLVKSGVWGLLLFLWQIRLLWYRLRIREKSTKVIDDIRLGKAILLGTLLATLVITGPYNKGGWFSTMLILGMILRDIRNFKLRIVA